MMQFEIWKIERGMLFFATTMRVHVEKYIY